MVIMRRPEAAHLKRSQMLLELAKSNAGAARIRWHSEDLGAWETARPRWQVLKGRIRFQFFCRRRCLSLWISSVKPKPWGVDVFLSGDESPIPEVFEVAWRQVSPEDGSARPDQLWKTVRKWLKGKYPGHVIVGASKKSDLSRTLSGLFLRVHFRHLGRDFLLIAADPTAEDAAHLAIGQALLWLSTLAAGKQFNSYPIIHILTSSEASALLAHRGQFLNRGRVKVEVWEYRENAGEMKIQRSADPPAPEENKDYRWPVLGPFRWSPQLEQVLNLAPDLIRRYPRFQNYDSLRLWGLEFAQVMGPDRDQILFGVGTLRTELTERNFEDLRGLVSEILFYRRPDSPDTQHPFYRLQAERWLEALILEDIPHLFPEMAPESMYSQIPVYLGPDPGRIDILGADRLGTLIVMELKVTPDPDLPLQALDYWGRVIQHHKNGDFERRGYFSEVCLNRQRPKIYLVSPIFSFHDSTESLLRYLEPDLEVWKISVNNDWRCGVKIMRRIHYRCRDLA